LIEAKAPNFFEALPWIAGGKKLWNYIKQFDPFILTALPSSLSTAAEQKVVWCKKHLGLEANKVYTVWKSDKLNYYWSKGQ